MSYKIVNGRKVVYGNFLEELKAKPREELTLAEIVYILEKEIEELKKRVKVLEENK